MFTKEINATISDGNIPWHDLQDAAFFVTGATGLVGSNLVRILAAADDKYNLNLKIIGHGRNEKKSKILTDTYGITFISGDIRNPIPRAELPDKIDYIIHAAAITQSADMAANPADVLSVLTDGTRNTLELARDIKCKKYLYLSSMEVYGHTDKKELREDDLGYVGLSNPRSSYPEGKRMCEALCSAYAAQYDVPAVIARLSRTFGAGFPGQGVAPGNDSDMRVAAQFARSATLGKDIQLHTQGKSIANCCHTFDTVRGLLAVLLKGKTGEAYNISNPRASVSVYEMAEVAANAARKMGKDVKIIVNVPEDIETCGYNEDIGYIINSDKLASLGWLPKYSIDDMFEHLLRRA